MLIVLLKSVLDGCLEGLYTYSFSGAIVDSLGFGRLSSLYHGHIPILSSSVIFPTRYCQVGDCVR